MRYSYSRVDCFEKCRYQFYLRYIQGLTTMDPPEAGSPLIVGSAMHHGLEQGSDAMEDYYYHQFPVISDLHVHEMMKLKALVEKAQRSMEQLIDGRKTTFEYEIVFPEFTGFVDFLIHNQDGSMDVFDFKYSNNVENYQQSKQLHLYKHFLEASGFTVSKLGYIFIPKTYIRQKKVEDLYQFRKRLLDTLATMDVKILEVPYDPQKVEEFLQICREIKTVNHYDKTPSKLCAWCEFQKYCEEGIDYMLLPKNEKRERTMDLNPDQWIYGDSYVGKSSFVDAMENLLFVNTDGNLDNTVSPAVRITDEVSYEGRLRKEKLAWEVFLDTITELEKKENTFQRVAVDLVEDLYEHCRLYIYRKLGIDHEQDAGFGKGWDMVKTEFLSAMKRLKNLGYQILFISKESTIEITLKNGSKLTTIKPNINSKIANVLTGIVDVTARAYMDGDDRYLLLEKQENIFGGGRFNFKVDKVKLDIGEFTEALKAAQEGVKTYSKAVETPKEEAPPEPQTAAPSDTAQKPARKSRRSSK